MLALGPGLRRRHVFGVSLRRAVIDPLHNRRNLIVRERRIILEFLDAYRLVEMPRRHLTTEHSGLDRPRPRPTFLEGPERHGRDGTRPMTRLALRLKDGCDILRERGVRCNLGMGDPGSEPTD